MAASDPSQGPQVPRERPDNRCPTDVKVEIVLRLLRGEAILDVARSTGRPPRQLSAWRRRFLEGAQAALDGRADLDELDALREAKEELSTRVAELTAENRRLSRRVALLSPSRSKGATPHPFCSKAYASALADSGVQPLHVPEWGTYVLVRETPTGLRQATGVRPIASLDPDCDLVAGIDALRRSGISSLSLVTDPMWCPDLPALQEAFASCRAFKESYFIDRETERVHLRKRHRNMVNRARRTVEIRQVALADHMDRWLELYQGNVKTRQIAQPFTETYFGRLMDVPGLRTIAVLTGDEIVTMTLWIAYQDILYYHDGASSELGFEISASYAAFAHVIDNAADSRYIVLGGAAHFADERSDGLATFKRGFANASATSYLCSIPLKRPARPSP